MFEVYGVSDCRCEFSCAMDVQIFFNEVNVFNNLFEKLLILILYICDSVCRKWNLLDTYNGFSLSARLSIVSFKKVIVLMISLIFIMFSLIRLLDTFVMLMTSFSTLAWSTWLSYSLWISCFICSTSSSSAVPNEKLNSPPKGRSDLLFLLFWDLCIWSIRLDASSWVAVISSKMESRSVRVRFRICEYLGSLFWKVEEYSINDSLTFIVLTLTLNNGVLYGMKSIAVVIIHALMLL